MTITAKDNQGRTQRSEIWFHENFIAIHWHLFTDNPEVAKEANRSRKIWGCYYCAFESILPKWAFNEIIESKEAVEKFVKWYKDEKKESVCV